MGRDLDSDEIPCCKWEIKKPTISSAHGIGNFVMHFTRNLV